MCIKQFTRAPWQQNFREKHWSANNAKDAKKAFFKFLTLRLLRYSRTECFLSLRK